MTEELWKPIPEFPNYQISNLGRVYNNRTEHIMSTSLTNFGHVKITLKSDWSDERFTRSVAQMVAEAFLEPLNCKDNQVVVLNGDFSNVEAANLAWRPRWYAWKYSRQLKARQPVYYKNLAVRNVVTDVYYNSIEEAGMAEGLLFDDIWRSTYTHAQLFPYGAIFEVIQRV